ncbi:MAG: DUF4112 domain-containing protein [Candidatus Altimarinota bacterium]
MKDKNDKKLDKREQQKDVLVKSDHGRESLRGDVVKGKIEEYEQKVEGGNKSPEKAQLTPQQKEIMDRLKTAKNAQERVDTFATLADTYGLDALISLFPELGDLGSSGLSGLYLLYEARNAGLSRTSMLKIVALQTADVFVGAIPILGDVADYFFKANKWSASSFKKQVEAIKKEARKSGVPEEELRALDEGMQSKIYKGVRWTADKAAPFIKGGSAKEMGADMIKRDQVN